jgi:hypothetical protein
MNLTPLAAVLVLALLSGEAWAEGIRFKGETDRYDGPATVLTLTADQQAQADKAGLIALTDEQRKQLEKDSGLGPGALYAMPLKEAHDTCTCEVPAFGIRFEPGKLEVPHEYLNGDVLEPTPEPKPRRGLGRRDVRNVTLLVGGLVAGVAGAWALIRRRRNRRRRA